MNIDNILDEHKLWLNSNTGSRANLSGTDLSKADLSGADLSEADLSGANLSGAYLSRAELSEADLSKADLSGADLFKADLSDADLSGANLSGVNLSNADLSRANLSGANLFGASLSRANLLCIEGKDIYTLNSSQHFAYCCDGYITIGCITKSIAEWIEQYEQIGKENNYSDDEIKNYGNWIKMMRGEQQ